jgi:hypothetical protein
MGCDVMILWGGKYKTVAMVYSQVSNEIRSDPMLSKPPWS